MNRLELQQLAEDRIADAAALLTAGRWSGAYYMAGYAVECGLKACIAKLTKEYDFPRERKYVEECYTHDLEKLLRAAGLSDEMDADKDANPALEVAWEIVTQWREVSRYEQKTQAEAEAMCRAITQDPDGVLSWIRQRW
jgi:HEPN domain-containing protein